MPDPVIIDVIVQRTSLDVAMGGQTTIVSSGADLRPRSAVFLVPAKPWIVPHSLGYIPQAWATDLNGNSISIEINASIDRIIAEPAAPAVGYLYYR